MSDILPFIIVGLTTGSLYGLAGIGLVLTYRTSGIFNFAHGAIAAGAAYLFYELHTVKGLPWPVAAAVSVVGIGVVGGIATERLARVLVGSRISTIIVATVGLLLAIQGFLYLQFGVVNIAFEDFLPTSGITVSGVNVSYGQMITVAISIVAAATLFLFLRTSRLGVFMRGVVDAPDLVSLTGTNPATVRTIAWMIGTSFAALTGILIAPTIGLDAGLLTLLVVQAFGAVAIGRFSSLPWTFAGGLVVGVVAALMTKEWGARPPLNGLPAAVPFFILIGVLLATAARHLPVSIGRPGGAIMRSRQPAAARIGGAAVVVLGLVLLPSFAGARLLIYTNALVFGVVFLSLALLLQTSGQISLCHAAFVMLGATTFSHLTTGLHLPWLLALLLTGVILAPVGALLAIPAIRLSGVYLALATFGFGLLVQSVGTNSVLMLGDKPLLAAPRPQLGFLDGADDKHFYYLVLAVTLLATFAVSAVVRSRLGRFLRALADSPTALTTQGLNVNATRLLVFCLSAFLAGVAGALVVSQFGQITRDSALGPFQSIMWLALLSACGTRILRSSFLAAGILVVAPSYLTGLSQPWQTMLFGIGAIVAALATDGGVDWGAIGRRLAATTDHRRLHGPVRARQDPAVRAPTVAA